MLTIPSRPRWLNLLTAFYAVFLFFALTPGESIALVTIFGWLLAGLLTTQVIFRYAGRSFAPRRWVPAGLAIGAFTGLTAACATAFLMILRSTLHESAYGDFSLPLILAIVIRIPAWSLAGVLLAAGGLLLIYPSTQK
jgi:hypothetical protein